MTPNLLAGILTAFTTGIADPNGSQPTDRFAGADSTTTLGTATTGQVWTAHTGTWGVKGNRAYLVSQAGDSVATIDAGIANVDVSADVTYYGDCGVVFRAIDDQNYWLILFDASTDRIELYKRVSGTYTLVGTYLTTLVVGTTYNARATASGSSIAVYFNGTQVITATDSSLSTATRIGLRQNSTAANRWANIIAKPFSLATARRVAYWIGEIHSPGILRSDTSSAKTFIGWANPNKETSTLAAGDQWARYQNLQSKPSPVQLILDTDFSTDVDDVMDLKTCLVYHTEGLANLIGVAVTTSRSKAPGAAAAVMQYYGVSGVPVSSYAPLGTFDPGTDATLYDSIYDNYTHTGVGLASTVTDTSTALASWLNSSSGNVVYVMTGFAKALATFLQASASNVTLFAAKVAKIVVVAGKYPNDGGSPEFNFVQNAADWAWLNANSPVPIVWAGIEIGNAVGQIGGSYLTSRLTNADVMVYALNQWNAQYSSGLLRNPWGLVGICYAVEGIKDFTSLIAGTNSINSSTGSNIFTAGAGSQSYLTMANTQMFAAKCQSIVAADVAPGVKTWSGSAWA